jgi:hypothetical protein
MDDKFSQYMNLNKEMSELRKRLKEKKLQVNELENDIMNYMENENLNSIALEDGEIILYDKKKSNTFKKETITEKLTEKLKCNEKTANDLADSILTNKVFTVEPKIKAKLKNNDD